jgi:transcriptional regulator with XRE-family HTH domain
MKRPMTPRQHLGTYLRHRRLLAGKTQWDVARAMRYTTAQFISNWERGISVPPEEVFIPLADQLGLDPLELASMVLSVPEDEHAIHRKKVMHDVRAALKARKGKKT